MADPYFGEIRLLPFTFAPTGWLTCDGSSLQITDYLELFNLIGTTYGGDGQTTFNLPDLRSRIPVHIGQGPGLSSYVLGEAAGTETVTLNAQQMPQHNHSLLASASGATTATPGPSVAPATVTGDTLYIAAVGVTGTSSMAAATIGAAGQNLPHENTMPTLVARFCIANTGSYPSQS